MVTFKIHIHILIYIKILKINLSGYIDTRTYLNPYGDIIRCIQHKCSRVQMSLSL